MGGHDTNTTAAPVGTRIPITGPRTRYKASSGSRGWAPGAQAGAGGDWDCAEGPSPALHASTFVRLLTEAVLWATTSSTGRCGRQRGRGKRNVDEGRVGRIEIRGISEHFLCTNLFLPYDRQPSGLGGIATPS